MKGSLADHSLSRQDRDSYSFEELCRQFSDREQFIHIFDIVLHQLPPVPVLMFYGVGGIGKTFLLRYLMYEYGGRQKDAVRKYPHVFLSFRSGHTPTSTEKALCQAREQLLRSKQPIKFPRFDLLSGKLQERGYQIKMSQNRDLVPTWIATITELLQPFGISIPIRVINSFGYHIKSVINVRRIGPWLRDKIEIPSKLEWKVAIQTMELKDLVALLPVAFAADIAESAAKFSPPYDRIILFVDNYETIQEQLGEMFGKETHNFVQSLARELVDLNSKALLVIAGRDRLRWGEVRRRDGNWVLDPTSLWAQDASRRDAQIYISRFLEQYCIGDLSETDAREYLIEQHELTHPTFVSAIFEFTGGYPLALGVAADLIDEADAQMSVDFMALRTRVLEYKPFSNEWREEVNDWLLERLLEQLKINHREELLKLTKAAAIPRWFTLELLFHLTEDSVLADQFRRLVGYSFVEPYEVEDLHAYRLHSVVRKIIRQTIEIPEWSDHMEKAAIEYFETQAGKFSGKSNWRYLFEMVYLLPVSHYQYWFRQNRTKCPEVVKTHA